MQSVPSPAKPLAITGDSPPDAKDRIIRASFHLFACQGYARTSVQGIAEAAGVKKPVLYYYFGNKEGLYRALVDQSSLLLMRFLGEATVVAGTADRVEARLARLAETLLGLARDNTDPVRFFFAHFFAADADRPACDSQDLERRPPHVIRKLAEEGIETGELFGEAAELERLVIGAIQYSIIKHLRHPEEEPLLPGLGGRIVRAAIAGFGTRRP